MIKIDLRFTSICELDNKSWTISKLPLSHAKNNAVLWKKSILNWIRKYLNLKYHSKKLNLKLYENDLI